MNITRDCFYASVLLISLIVWNTKGQENNVIPTDKSTSASGTKPVQNYAYQTRGFNNSQVTSGPVLVIDKKTIFISALNYKGDVGDAHFLVGNGQPSANGTLVADENNSNSSLRAYVGKNIYLKLPGNLTTDKIDYLAMWSLGGKNLGSVILYSNNESRNSIPEALGYDQITIDNKQIFRVPKCCKPNEMMNATHCIESKLDQRLATNVFQSNETHIDSNAFIPNIELIPYVVDTISCPEKNEYRISLNKSEALVGLIYNSSFIYVDGYGHGVLSHDRYCMDIEKNETDFYFCFPADPDGGTTLAYMSNLYFSLLVISTLCFLSSAVTYYFILKPKDLHMHCFIGFSASMTVTFLGLIFLQKIYTACSFTGSLFLFSISCSFIWLACLCIDLVICVMSYKEIPEEIRLRYYIGASIVLPLLLLIISLSPDGIPDVPHTFVKKYDSPQDGCNFEGFSISLFATPIGVLIFVSLLALCYASYLIQTKNSTDHEWVSNKSKYKFKLRSCFLVWTTTCIWFIEAILSLQEMSIGISFAIDLIEAAQGIFVLFIFVLNKYTRREVMEVLNKKKIKKKREGELRQMMERLNSQESNDDRRNNCDN